MNQATELSPLVLPSRRGRLAFLWKRIAVPRFAIVGLVACATIAIAMSSMIRAQSHPLWFEFGYSPHNGFPLNYLVAKEGFDDTPACMYLNSGIPIAAALRVKVESISTDDVVLRVRAAPARIEATATGVKLLGGPIGGVSLEGVPKVHYKPGESLPVSIEGGGTLYLKGDVLDHQPKIAFGTPLVPTEDKVNIRSPVLIESGKLVGELEGASTIADASGEAAFLSVADRVFTFALRPFPGAVQAEANWGQISFKVGGMAYSLIAAAPITGGGQPRPVWVRVAEHLDGWPQCSQTCLGSGPVPK
jgi:hypothetical protein